MTSRPCPCGATEGVRQYMNGPACPRCTPAALAGHPEPPAPDPANTAAGLQRAARARTAPTAARAPEPTLERAPARDAHAPAADLDAHRRGATYDPDTDHARLNGQMRKVYEFLARDCAPHTLAEISAATGAPEASISARFRDLWNLHRIPTDRWDHPPGGGPALYVVVAKDAVPEGQPHPLYPEAIAGEKRPSSAWKGAREKRAA